MNIKQSLVMGVLFVLSSIAGVACTHLPFGSAPPQDPSRGASGAAPALYQEGTRLLEDGNAEAALAAFDRFGVENPASPWTQLAVYNSARALESLARWSEAAERYRGVARAAGSSAPRLQALALYRLSFCAEGEGADDVALAALRDVADRARHLPAELRDAEFPARVAGAYARLGNFEAAREYYAKADKGIAMLRRASGPGALPEWLPRTLYQMGATSSRAPTWETVEISIRPLKMGQTYLLQAAETGIEPWSGRAIESIASAYAGILSAIQSPPPAPDGVDPIPHRREMQERAWNLAAESLAAADELRARRAPGDGQGASARLFKVLDEASQKLQATLSDRPAGEGLTEESRARRDRIQNRSKNPKGSLKRDSRARLPRKAPAP